MKSSLLLAAFACQVHCGGPPAPEPQPRMYSDEQLGMTIVLKPRNLVPAGAVSVEIQEYLAERMRNHGRDNADLMVAVVLIDYTEAERMASRLAMPVPSSPYHLRQERKLRSAFPETFFDLELDLHTAAARVASAARAENLDGMSKAHAKLVATCLDCHAAFTRRANR